MARPFIPAPHVASVEFIYTYSSIVCENVVHILGETDFDTSMVAQTWDLAKAWWIANMKPKAHGSLTFNRLKVKAQHSDTAPVLDNAIIPAQAGTMTGIALPNNATWCVKMATGLAGRSARGRWFVAGLTSDQVSNSINVSIATASGFITALANLQTAFGAVPAELCITSYRHNKAWRAEAVSYPVNAILYTDVFLDSQRRRLAGRGK